MALDLISEIVGGIILNWSWPLVRMTVSWHSMANLSVYHNSQINCCHSYLTIFPSQGCVYWLLHGLPIGLNNFGVPMGAPSSQW